MGFERFRQVPSESLDFLMVIARVHPRQFRSEQVGFDGSFVSFVGNGGNPVISMFRGGKP